MELFENFIDTSRNLLPKDGEVNYYGKIFSSTEADHFFDVLLHDVHWRNDEVLLFGKRIVTKRKIAWYADQKRIYTYSGVSKTSLPWIQVLRVLKEKVEEKTGEKFNACLLNLYHDGSEGMAWHSDAERDLKQNAAIASLSFGAARKFAFKHKQTQEKIELLLESGSLLVMKGVTQKFWLHCLPPTKKVKTPRINLTFRTIL